MILYLTFTDETKTIIKCKAYEDMGNYLKVFTDFGYKKIHKYVGLHEDFSYTPGIYSYQVDGSPLVLVKTDDIK